MDMSLASIAHFFRNAPEFVAKQKQLGKGELADWLNTRIHEQGF